mgnify:CR=1 FL=1
MHTPETYLAEGRFLNMLHVRTKPNFFIDNYTATYQAPDNTLTSIYLKVSLERSFLLEREHKFHTQASNASSKVLPLVDIVLKDANGLIPSVATPLHHGDLHDYIRECGPQPDELCRHLFEACESASDITAAGIVHRDIKPENIAMLPNGRAALFDFDNSTTIDCYDRPLMITRGYEPPEVLDILAYDGMMLRASPAQDYYCMARCIEELLEENLHWHKELRRVVDANKHPEPTARPGWEPLKDELHKAAKSA